MNPFYKLRIKKRLMKRLALVLFFPFVLLTACEKSDYPSSEWIDSDIIIEMWETLDPDERTFRFKCRTARIYPCYNFGIGRTLQKRPGRITILFQGIIRPGLCLTALGPARTTVELGSLETGTYELDIRVENRQSLGQLLVSDEYYEVNFHNRNQLRFDYDRLYKVPEHTIWGRIGYHAASTQHLAESFLDSLQLAGASEKEFSHGQYGYFFIGEDGEVKPPQYPGTRFVKTFIFHYQDDVAILEQLVKNYGIHYHDSLSIRLYTDKGEIFRSWTYAN